MSATTIAPYRTFLQFKSKQDAMDYRHQNGTGGWIFSSHSEGLIVLFPPDMCPNEIFRHRLVQGLSGDLIGNQ